MYVLGNTKGCDFPLILTIGREPNYDEALDNTIGIINKNEFDSLSGGVWVTAYTQIAKQYFGASGTSRMLKDLCFEKDVSPIVFSNAFPMAILNSVANKASVRENLMSLIPAHITNIFDNSISNRFRLVIQHGSDQSAPSLLAADLIQKECAKRKLPYFTTPFFYNGNSLGIQSALCNAKPDITKIVDCFIRTPNKAFQPTPKSGAAEL